MAAPTADDIPAAAAGPDEPSALPPAIASGASGRVADRNRTLAITLAITAMLIGVTAVGLTIGLHYAEAHHLIAAL